MVKLLPIMICTFVAYYYKIPISELISNFSIYFPFVNITTYLDLMKYVIIPKFKNIDSETLFTPYELRLYNGEDKPQLYLSILGNVFDVTTAASYYGVGQVYHGFTGRDASQAFITGDFSEEGLVDDVLSLMLHDFRQLKEWLKMYQKKYVYKGKLIGKYYDSLGKPTDYNKEVQRLILEAEKDKDLKNIENNRFPPCNVEWDINKGSRVWCTNRSGGIERNWIGVPRKLYLPGSKSYRCACVSSNILQKDSSFTFRETPKYLMEYEDCDPNSHTCYIKT